MNWVGGAGVIEGGALRRVGWVNWHGGEVVGTQRHRKTHVPGAAAAPRLQVAGHVQWTVACGVHNTGCHGAQEQPRSWLGACWYATPRAISSHWALLNSSLPTHHHPTNQSCPDPSPPSPPAALRLPPYTCSSFSRRAPCTYHPTLLRAHAQPSLQAQLRLHFAALR